MLIDFLADLDWYSCVEALLRLGRNNLIPYYWLGELMVCAEVRGAGGFNKTLVKKLFLQH